MLAEDVQLVAFEGAPDNATWVDNAWAEELLLADPDENIHADQAATFVQRVIDGFDHIMPYLTEVAERRAEELLDQHKRVRSASRYGVCGIWLSHNCRRMCLEFTYICQQEENSKPGLKDRPMDTYMFTQVDLGASWLRISTTDSAIFDGLVRSLKTHIPKIKQVDEIPALDTGSTFYMTFKNLASGDFGAHQTLWLVLTYMCQQGWEPFAHESGTYFFRKVNEAES